MTYRRIVVARHGPPEVLEVLETKLPEPAAGEVRIKVIAAGVSAYDLMLRRSGSLPGTPKVPYTPGEDIVGTVNELGKGVSTVDPGQIVAGFTFGAGGGYTEYICRPADQLVPVPEGVDPAVAVCLVVNYLTSHLALHRTARIRSGEIILVHGAAGGIGTALLQLGRLAGLEMYGTASAYNHDLVCALGATPIDYRTEDFVARIHDLIGAGVDAVFDPIGGARQLRRSYRALRKGGRLVWFGMAAAKTKGLRIIPFTLLTQGVLALLPDGKGAPLMPDLGTFATANPDWYRDTLAELLASAAAGRIEPVVAERFPLTEAARAHELLEHGGYAGKVVLLTDL